jgi:hypothetical protein
LQHRIGVIVEDRRQRSAQQRGGIRHRLVEIDRRFVGRTCGLEDNSFSAELGAGPRCQLADAGVQRALTELPAEQ